MNQDRLRELALRYVGRYATTRFKLKSYLSRKLQERGWDDEQPADIAALVESFAELGYVDDALFAEQKAAALARRGYGKRRVSQALFQSGIAEDDGAAALEQSDEQRWAAARTYARKKSIGPFAITPADQEKRQKQLQAFLRAGHDFDIASRFVFAGPGDEIIADS